MLPFSSGELAPRMIETLVDAAVVGVLGNRQAEVGQEVLAAWALRFWWLSQLYW